MASIKALAGQSTNFRKTGDNSSVFASIVSAFQSAYNIIFDKGLLKVAQIVVDKLTAKEVATDKICVGVTCVTEDQLKTVLTNTGIIPASVTSTPTPEAISTTVATTMDNSSSSLSSSLSSASSTPLTE